MELEELTRRINETFLTPEEMGIRDLFIEDWIFVEDKRDEYLIYALVPAKSVDAMEAQRNTFIPLLAEIAMINELYEELELDKIGQIGYGEMDEEDYSLLVKMENSDYKVIDFNESREANYFLKSIMKLDLDQKPSRITIFQGGA